MRFHVFLCHSSADKLAVEELARRLTQEGIQARLGEWNLIAGDPWQPGIERASAESEICAICVGASGSGPWQNGGMRGAIDRRLRGSGRQLRLITVFLPDAPRASSFPTVLASTTRVEFGDSLDDPEAFQRLVSEIRGLVDSDSEQAPAPSLDERKQMEATNAEAAKCLVGAQAEDVAAAGRAAQAVRRATTDAEGREVAQKKRAERAEEAARERAVAVSKFRRLALLATGAAVATSILLALSVILWRKSASDGAKAREQARVAVTQRRAAEERARLAGQNTSNSGWQRELSVSYNKVGNALVAQGKLQEALAAYQQSLAILSRLVEQNKSNAGWQRDLSVSYDNVGDVLVAQGKFPEGLDAYSQSLRIRQTLTQRDQSNPRVERDLSVSYDNVGDVFAAQGKLPDAVKAYEQSLPILKWLAEQGKSDPSLERDLFVTYDKVADLLVGQGRPREALDAYQQSVAIFSQLAELDKSNAVLERDLSIAHNKLGDVLVAQSKFADALESLKGKRCCRQIKFYCSVCLLTLRWFCLSRILRAGPRTWSYQILKGILFAGTPQWKRKRRMLIAPRHSPSHQILGPAISEAAEPRCSTPSAIKLPDTPR